MSDETPKRSKRLTPKQQAFVRATLQPHVTHTDAYQQVYGQQNREIATKNANQLLAKPHVQRHIAEVIADKWPSVADDCMEVLRGYLMDPEMAPAIKLKSMELLTKFHGWQAPNKSMHLHAKVDAKKYKLPGEE